MKGIKITESGNMSDQNGHREEFSKPEKRSYVHVASTKSTLTYLTIVEYIEELANYSPHQTAIISSQQGIRKTYNELVREIEELAVGLLELGLRKGDRVAIWGRNSYEWMLTMLALARAGIIMVSICPAFKAAELEYALQKVQCKAVFVQHDLEDMDYYGTLSSIDSDIGATETNELSLTKLPHLKYIIYAGKDTKRGTVPFETLKRLKTTSNHVGEKPKPDDVFCIHYTSGTTGKPKAAAITHFSLLNNAIFTFDRCQLGKPMVVCLQLPLYHIYACIQLLGSFSQHGTVVLPSARFSPLASIKAVTSERCNYMVGVETMYLCVIEKLKEFKADLSSLEIIKIGGSKSKLDVITLIESTFNAKVSVGYGSTETSGTVSTSSYPEERDCPPDSCGRVQEHTEVKIINAAGETVALGEKGEVLVRGFQVFSGYWDDDDKTKEVIDSHGWYRTGDIGRLDAKGYLSIDGRLKNVIIRGGENIYPVEIEELLKQHQSVKNVQVVGVPDRKMGEELCAVVILDEDEQSGAVDEIKEFCKGRIAHFKIPKYFLFVDKFPTTPTGKIQKYLVTNTAAKLLGLAKESEE